MTMAKWTFLIMFIVIPFFQLANGISLHNIISEFLPIQLIITSAIFTIFYLPSMNINRIYRFHIETHYPALFWKQKAYYAEIEKAELLPNANSKRKMNVVILHRKGRKKMVVEAHSDFIYILKILKEKEVRIEFPKEIEVELNTKLLNAGLKR